MDEVTEVSWASEFANAIAAVMKKAIEMGPEAVQKALELFDTEITIRGWTPYLQRQIREARALAHQVPV